MGQIAGELRINAQDEMPAALLAMAPDGILAVDESGRVATVNAMASRLLGHASADIEGRELIGFLSPSVRGDCVAWLRDVQGRGDFADVCALRADGALASLQLAVRTTWVNGSSVFACYFRETRRHRRDDLDEPNIRRRELQVDDTNDHARITTGLEPIVYIVDRDAALRDLLAEVLRRCGWKAEKFASVQTFLAHERPCLPGCAVLDIDSQEMDGLGLRARMAADRASLPIIFTTSRGDVSTSVHAMKLGAFEFLIKPLIEKDLLAAIRDAIASSTSAIEGAARSRALEARYGSLTPRERDVMLGITSGLLNKQVAAELGISEITVKVHRARVMRKMQARSFAKLVAIAATLGLASPRSWTRPPAKWPAYA